MFSRLRREIKQKHGGVSKILDILGRATNEDGNIDIKFAYPKLTGLDEIRH